MADKTKTVNKKALLDSAVINNMMDRDFLNLLHELPDPDVILRKANIDHLVHNEILADAHVIGEVRSIRSGLLEQSSEVVAGDDTSAAIKAKELCEAVLDRRPDASMSPDDLKWSFGKATLHGSRVHHVEWMKEGGYLVPEKIFDIARSSYAFNPDGELLIRTKQSPTGELAEEHRWLTTRHMPDRENPYGTALLSACFWPWMFKNGGMKFFVKLCEKWGIPHIIGKHPVHTKQDTIDEIVEQLERLIEGACASVPEDTNIESLEIKGSGEAPQERIINLCNREISKALTSSSLTTEIIDGGSHAAAKTHGDKSEKIQRTDRKLVVGTINELFAWITLLNFGENVKPPKFVYKDKKELNVSDVNYFKSAAALVPIAKEAIYKGLNISPPKDGEEVVFFGNESDANEDKDKASKFSQFNKNDGWGKEDQVISDLIAQLKVQIDNGASLEEAKSNIVAMMPELESTALDELLKNQFEIEFGAGMVDELNSYQG